MRWPCYKKGYLILNKDAGVNCIFKPIFTLFLHFVHWNSPWYLSHSFLWMLSLFPGHLSHLGWHLYALSQLSRFFCLSGKTLVSWASERQECWNRPCIDEFDKSKRSQRYCANALTRGALRKESRKHPIKGEKTAKKYAFYIFSSWCHFLSYAKYQAYLKEKKDTKTPPNAIF